MEHKEYVSKAVHEERTCLKCGKPFISSNAKQKFCSQKCGKNACRHYKRTQEEINNEAFEKKIKILNEYEFNYVSGYKNQKSIVTIECQKCGALKNVQVDSIRERKKTICTHCVELEQQRKQEDLKIKKELISVLKKVEKIKKQEEFEKKHTQACQFCGNMFYGNIRKYCSEECQRKAFNKSSSHRKEHRVSKEKRNRSLTWKTLWNKGQHNCALCGKECDINDFYTKENGTIICGDNYPSLDHIVPVFMGGGDFLNNVQLACRKCNTLRGVREWQEYRKSQKQTLKV